MHVLLDTSPLRSGHRGRGIGRYTAWLRDALQLLPEVTLHTKFVPEVQIIHYPFFELFSNSLPLRSKRPVVVTIHDVIPLTMSKYYPVGIKGRLALAKQKAAARRAAAIITDSESARQDIHSHFGIPLDKIYPVYLAANPNLKVAREPAVAAIRRQYKLPRSYVLYVGDINYNKNIPQLIKMVKFLPEEVGLVCVGRAFKPQPIPEWQWIETQLALSDVSQRVTFITDIGTDGDAVLSALYSGAEAYIQPSLAEGFGLPVLEAMKCRTPVVASHRTSLIEVGGEYAVYAEPTAESLAEAVSIVLSWSAAKRLAWIRQAYAWSQRFSWEKTARDTLVVYEQVLR